MVLVWGAGRTRLGSVWSRVARCARVCALGGPDVCQALERPAMLTHTRCGRPIEERERVCGEPWLPARLRLARHVTVPATVVDQGVHLPALIRSRSCLERLLDHRTLPGCQVPSSLPLPRSIGGLLGSRRGIVGPHCHPVPSTPGGFPLDTGRIQAWSSHAVLARLDPCVTIWDVRACEGRCRYSARAATAPAGAAPCRRVPPLVHAPCVPPGDED
jgi:hypothetical protein